MRKLQIGLALLLASIFTAANAADSCPGVVLTNASGSPPVVAGTTIQYSVWGPSPTFYVYLDGNGFPVNDPNPNDPPWTYFNVLFTTQPVYYGNHTLSVNWDACVLNFSTTAPPIDYVNVTAGGSGPSWGFEAANFGSVSPTATSNGKTYKAIADTYNWWYGTEESSFFVCGFGSNPGQGWLTSVAVGSTTKLGSAATSYYYSSGCAYWHWSGYIGINYSGVTQVAVTHN